MRITRSMLNIRLGTHMSQSLRNLADVQRRASTGLSFDKVSQSPADAALTMRLNMQYKNGEKYIDNMNNISAYLTEAESALSDINSIVMDVIDITLKGANSSYNDADRETLASSVSQYQEQLIATGNTKFTGNYIFSGYYTKNAPFDVVADEMTYHGTQLVNGSAAFAADQEELQYIDLGKGITFSGTNIDSQSAFQTNVLGCDIMGYGDENIYKLLEDVEQSLLANDLDAIRATVEDLRMAQDDVLCNIVKVGEKDKFINSEITRTEYIQINREDNISKIQDVDYAKALMEYEQNKAAYEVLLSVGGRSILPTLADFL